MKGVIFLTGLVTGALDLIANAIDSLLPVYDLSESNYSTISTAFTSVADFLRQVNFIIPLSDILLIVGIDLGMRVFEFALFIGNWIIRRVADVIP